MQHFVTFVCTLHYREDNKNMCHYTFHVHIYVIYIITFLLRKNLVSL